MAPATFGLRHEIPARAMPSAALTAGPMLTPTNTASAIPTTSLMTRATGPGSRRRRAFVELRAALRGSHQRTARPGVYVGPGDRALRAAIGAEHRRQPGGRPVGDLPDLRDQLPGGLRVLRRRHAL